MASDGYNTLRVWQSTYEDVIDIKASIEKQLHRSVSIAVATDAIVQAMKSISVEIIVKQVQDKQSEQ